MSQTIATPECCLLQKVFLASHLLNHVSSQLELDVGLLQRSLPCYLSLATHHLPSTRPPVLNSFSGAIPGCCVHNSRAGPSTSVVRKPYTCSYIGHRVESPCSVCHSCSLLPPPCGPSAGSLPCILFSVKSCPFSEDCIQHGPSRPNRVAQVVGYLPLGYLTSKCEIPSSNPSNMDLAQASHTDPGQQVITLIPRCPGQASCLHHCPGRSFPDSL